jgi:hypothetical protein
MIETKTQSTAEILSEMIERVLNRTCPICGDNLSSSWELGCTFAPGLTNCRTLRRFVDDDPERMHYERREKIVGALRLLLQTRGF